MRLSFFARTLLLLLALLAASLLVVGQSFRTLDLEPRARQLAQQVVAIVNLTRFALVYADPIGRQAFLAELQENERVQVYLVEPTDKIEAPSGDLLSQRFIEYVTRSLGTQTTFARTVNGLPGVWISFTIETDQYWLRLERERLERNPGIAWLFWGVGALLLAIVGAVLITSFVTRPLRQLARSAEKVAVGKTPRPLPVDGPSEIALVNRSFNDMVSALSKVEEERKLMLAGISHDLRTPITRMRLELELAGLDANARSGFETDLAQMDSIVGQFIDIARPTVSTEQDTVLAPLVLKLGDRYANDPRGKVVARPTHAEAAVRGDLNAIERALTNLIENALRYGRPKEGAANVEILLSLEPDKSGKALKPGQKRWVRLAVRDHGPGVDPEDLDRLTRPFERGDAARTNASGAGLGLAIVDRIAQQQGGRLLLQSRKGEGFTATLLLPAA
ncbi:ATP-binding protein [Piscinibacterium candidicorallinum]|jgi:two-component system osmolarity sensor histidine kinase EnvZ|uniref:histidine kinase n=1 Tax=Piscinibacterium candidicorallinum TaxID=1793872 RepID=A0ABV7GYX8_9BURK